MVILTNHAKRRLKERMGVHKNYLKKIANKAFQKGLTRKDLKGGGEKYFDKLFLKYRKANNLRILGDFVFLFTSNVLITVLRLPDDVKIRREG